MLITKGRKVRYKGVVVTVTLHLPKNLPKPTFEEIRSCPIRSRIDDLTVRAGFNPPPIDARDMILHISDTPSIMFSYLRRALRRLRPAWVVHTGDFVDDIKLGQRPGMLDLYRKKLASLLKLFAEEGCRAILVTGNHDDPYVALEVAGNAPVQIWSKPGRFCIGDICFRAGHKFEDVATNCQNYNLYGHSLEYPTFIDGCGRFFLNGLEEMHLIHMETGEVIAVRYPPGTDSARLDRKPVSF